jgi:hypothetical protein
MNLFKLNFLTIVKNGNYLKINNQQFIHKSVTNRNEDRIDDDSNLDPNEKKERVFFKYQEEINGFKVFDIYLNKKKIEREEFQEVNELYKILNSFLFNLH